VSCRSWSRSRRRGSCSCVERELQPAPRPERGRTVLFSGGVSKGVVAYHFRSKDELLTQVVADVYATAGAEIQDRVAAASSPAAALRGYVEANLAFIQAHPAQIGAVAEIALNLRGPGGGLKFGLGADPVADHLEQLLVAGQERGALRRFNARAMAVVIRAAIDGASGRLLADPSFDLDAYRRELLRIGDLATRSDP
jgi:TetR/AcrR family fatty acid metabolism transcriptional regulator